MSDIRPLSYINWRNFDERVTAHRVMAYVCSTGWGINIRQTTYVCGHGFSFPTYRQDMAKLFIFHTQFTGLLRSNRNENKNS